MLREENHGPAADTFAFALLLYELYTQRRPFTLVLGYDLGMMRAQVANNGHRPSIREKDKVPEGIVALMRECWAAEAHERPAVTDVLQRLRSMESEPKVQTVRVTAITDYEGKGFCVWISLYQFSFCDTKLCCLVYLFLAFCFKF